MEFTVHPVLAVSDLNRAAKWYKDKLGMEPSLMGNEPIPPGTTVYTSELAYETPNATFGIYESKYAGQNQATAVKFVTKEFDAAHAELLANGVEFEVYDIEEYFSEPDGNPYWDNGALVSPDGEKTAWFKDSEGNVLSIGTVY